jgi:hypothetical protein
VAATQGLCSTYKLYGWQQAGKAGCGRSWLVEWRRGRGRGLPLLICCPLLTLTVVIRHTPVCLACDISSWTRSSLVDTSACQIDQAADGVWPVVSPPFNSDALQML